MAKIIEPPPHGNCKYPWDKWNDGAWHEAVAGKTFQCNIKSFRTSLHVKAYTWGGKAETHISGNKVTFRFLKPEQPKKVKNVKRTSA